MVWFVIFHFLPKGFVSSQFIVMEVFLCFMDLVALVSSHFVILSYGPPLLAGSGPWVSAPLPFSHAISFFRISMYFCMAFIYDSLILRFGIGFFPIGSSLSFGIFSSSLG